MKVSQNNPKRPSAQGEVVAEFNLGVDSLDKIIGTEGKVVGNICLGRRKSVSEMLNNNHEPPAVSINMNFDFDEELEVVHDDRKDKIVTIEGNEPVRYRKSKYRQKKPRKSVASESPKPSQSTENDTNKLNPIKSPVVLKIRKRHVTPIKSEDKSSSKTPEKLPLSTFWYGILILSNWGRFPLRYDFFE